MSVTNIDDLHATKERRKANMTVTVCKIGRKSNFEPQTLIQKSHFSEIILGPFSILQPNRQKESGTSRKCSLRCHHTRKDRHDEHRRDGIQRGVPSFFLQPVKMKFTFHEREA